MFHVNLGPDFRCEPEPSEWVPPWLNYENESEFKKQYAEYITEVIERGKITIGGYDLYELGVEINDWRNLPWQTPTSVAPTPEEV